METMRLENRPDIPFESKFRRAAARHRNRQSRNEQNNEFSSGHRCPSKQKNSPRAIVAATSTLQSFDFAPIIDDLTNRRRLRENGLEFNT
jgi:hypothetical protein